MREVLRLLCWAGISAHMMDVAVCPRSAFASNILPPARRNLAKQVLLVGRERKTGHFSSRPPHQVPTRATGQTHS